MRVTFASAVCLLLAPAMLPNPYETVQQLFNGSNLEGWRADTQQQWQVKGGELVGATHSGKDAWLTLNKSYEDVDLELTFQCVDCDAGILLREGAVNGQSEKRTGLYLSFAGANAPSIYRLTLNEAGDEVDRKLLAATAEPTSVVPFTSLSIYGSRNRDGHYFRIEDGTNGWKHLHFLLRGDLVPHGLGQHAESTTAGMPSYGPLALHIASGEIRFKEVALIDLTRPIMGVAPRVTSNEFRELQLTDGFYSEGITAGDVNHDGIMDVVSGPFAYLGPDYHHAVEIYPPLTYNFATTGQQGSYTDSFLEYLYDFDGDGWPDLLKINFEGAFLYINPRGESRHWTEYKVVNAISAETTQLADIDGDGKPELIMSTGPDPDRTVGFAKPDWSDVTKPWKFYPVSTKGSWSGHGMGYADLNGDGRVDILQGSGWWEQPAAGAESGLWKFHEVPFGRGNNSFIRGADLLVYDVNGDGVPDVITSFFAHGPGLGWFETKRNSDGTVSFTQHIIMDAASIPMNKRTNWEETDKTVAFTELHALALADMDGDGLKDIVTGKRWWSHGMEFQENDLDDPPVMYWFKLVRKPGGKVEFVPHLINNFSGVGTQIFVTDLNRDGRPDVMTAQRKGAFIFFNEVNRH